MRETQPKESIEMATKRSLKRGKKLSSAMTLRKILTTKKK
jgi:hypothetical protein